MQLGEELEQVKPNFCYWNPGEDLAPPAQPSAPTSPTWSGLSRGLRAFAVYQGGKQFGISLTKPLLLLYFQAVLAQG